MKTIQDKRWECATSIYTLLEVMDNKKDNKFAFNKLETGHTFKWILRHRDRRDLSDREIEDIYEKVYNEFFDKYKFVEFYELDIKGWERAIELSRKSNISAPDLIHLATAQELNCDFLVTNDDSFLKQAKKFMPSCASDTFVKYFESFNLLI
jgi:predicted nucleic acid-binding protein